MLGRAVLQWDEVTINHLSWCAIILNVANAAKQRVREVLAGSTPSARCGLCARAPFLSERVNFVLRSFLSYLQCARGIFLCSQFSCD